MVAPPRRTQKFTGRIWPVYAFMAVLLGVIVAEIITHHASSPAASLAPVPKVTSRSFVVASPSPSSSTPTPTPTPTMEIPGSAVEQLYIPASDPSKVINDPVLPMPSACQKVIDPPRTGPDLAKVFQCTDFAMPGTNTATNAVIAGHASNYTTTVFNKLYTQGDALVGRQIFVRTQASGQQWLRYTVRNIYEPLKTELPYQAQIWTPTPGRLILVTCFETPDRPTALRNFVVVAQFDGVQNNE